MIDREAGESMNESDALLWERNYTNTTLKNTNNETDLNERRVFPKGASYYVIKCNTKYNHYS